LRKKIGLPGEAAIELLKWQQPETYGKQPDIYGKQPETWALPLN